MTIRYGYVMRISVPGLRDLSYEEILKECGLITLETGRLKGDQI